jgi:hypothetical protein
MTFSRVSFLLAAASVAFVAAACDTATESENPPVAEGGVTYQAGIKAVIDQKCANCHQAGGIGPFSLETYEDVSAHINAVRSAIESGSMPPWPVKDDCNDYKNDRSLDPADKEKLLAWIDAGAPEGSTPEAEEGESAAGLSRVDRTLEMPVDYTPVMAPDDYRCFLLDWNEAETTYVTGFRANPGNASTVHHVIAYLIPPSQVAKYQALDAQEEAAGYTCFGGPGGGIDQETRFVGSWAPGTAGGDLPDGTGIRVEPGSKIALQVHYNTSHGSGPDRTSIDLKIDSSVEHEGVWQFFTNVEWLFGAGMEIPPMTSDVKHEYAMDPTGFVSAGKSFVIHSVGLHMHTLGQSIRLSVERPQTDAEACLLDIPQWDFHWQGSYDLEQPLVFQPGERLKISCTWDNPTDKTVRWGEGTGDEMCLGLIYYTVP